MKSLLAKSLLSKSVLVAASLLTILVTGSAAAGEPSWIFQRSYYSHDPVTHVRIGRQFAPGPVYTRPQGEYINAGYRNLHSTIRAGRETSDHLNVWESWYQVGAQF